MARSGGIRIEGAGDLSAGLVYASKEVVAGAAEALKTGAAMLKQRAHDYAPLDEGDLERSIKILERNLSKRAAASGEMSIEIGVDGEIQKRSREDVMVGDYAGYMEGGQYELGRKSEEKNEEMSAFYSRDIGGGNAVGPGFFSRAIDDGEPYVKKVIAEKIRTALAKANRRVSAMKSKTGRSRK